MFVVLAAELAGTHTSAHLCALPCGCLPACHVQRGRVPIVVGGTGFYLRWLVGGKAAGPRTTPHAAAAVQVRGP